MNPAVGQEDLFRFAPHPAVEALHAATAIYTREPVVEHLLDLLEWPHGGGTLLDPGAGDAVFAERALARLDLAPDDLPAVDRVQAWEIHPHAADAARWRISRHLLRRGWSAAKAQLAAERVVVLADFLAPGPTSAEIACIAGNPPYLRFAALPEHFKRLYARFVPAYARSDLLPAFLNRCAETLREGGKIACVTADRWLFNATQADLREHLGRRFGLAACTRLNAVSAFHRSKTRRPGTPPRVHSVAVLLTSGARNSSPLTREPIHPGAATAAAGTRRLGDVATVRLAPWLGSAGVFVVDRTSSAGLPEHALVPCVDTDDLQGDVLREPTRFAIRTSRGEPAEEVLRHLRLTVGRLPMRARRTPFWLPPESWGPLPWNDDALLVPRIARSIRAIKLPAGILPINHNLSVVVRGGTVDALAAAITAPEAQRWIRDRAPRLENGFLSITTRMLRELPVRLD